MAIDYRNLILKTVPGTNEVEPKVAAPRAKAKPTIQYTIEGISGPDIVITKQSKMKKDQLVILLSQGQIYLKDLKNNAITNASNDDIQKFFNGLEGPLTCIDDDGNTLNWTGSLSKSAYCAANLCKLRDTEWLRPYLTHGLVDISDKILAGHIGFTNTFDDFNTVYSLYKMCPDNLKPTMKYFISSGMTDGGYRPYYTNRSNDPEYNKVRSVLYTICCDHKKDNYAYSRYIEPVYSIIGHSGVNQMIKEYFRTAVSTFPSFEDLYRLFRGDSRMTRNMPTSENNFKFENLLHYLFYSSVEQGYAFDISGFIHTWNDSLAMAKIIFKNGPQNKYPENLSSYHQILSYKYTLLKQTIDEQKWEVVKERLGKNQYKGQKYSIISPQTPNDMYDEARQQSNCLSSYVQRVTDGLVQIYFLRDNKALDKSLVTIEVRENNTLGQVLGKYNKRPSEEQLEFVRKWHEKFFKMA